MKLQKPEIMPYTDHTDPDTIQKFNEVAEGYDQHFANRFDRAEENVLFDRYGHLLQRADVLDIGCGTGLVKRLSDRLLFRPRKYTGVDASSEMIIAASKKHKLGDLSIRTPSKSPYGSSGFAIDDMVEFMWAQPPASYDVVTSFYFPMNYCDQAPREVYEAVAHVLRPGGHFINVMATSRYAVRQSHILGAANLRRYFEPNDYYLNDIRGYFNTIAIVGFNYFIEKYRRWLNLCPQVVIEAMFRFDQRMGEKSGAKPYFYGIHLQKPSLDYEKTPLDM